MQHILPAALARGFDPSEPRDESGRWTDGGGDGSDAPTSFISPNVSTLTFDEAVNALNGDRQKQITAASREIDDGLGIKSTNYPAIGAWSDGAENSLMVVAPGATSAQVRAASAMKGYIADQKAVLVFHPSPTGQNFLASFDVEGKAGDLHDQLLKDDLSFHTLQPLGDDRFRIHVFGSDQATIDAVHKAATGFGIQPKFVRGDGEFIGTTKEDGTDREQRDDARQKYQEVIDAVADSSDVEGRNVGALWRQVRDHWSESEAGSGTSKHAGPGYPARARLIDGIKAKGFSQLSMRKASILLPPALFKKYYGAACEFFAANAHLTPRNLDDIVLVVRSEPLYVHRDLQNVDEFTAWATSQGFDEINDDLHVTVLYSKTAVDWDDMGDRETDHLVVPAGGERTIEVLGDGAVALVFASTALARRHGEMLGDGASSDYDAYVPHVTINLSGMIPDDVVPYDGELIFGPEIFETIVIEKEFDELETRAGKKTVVELWPEQDESRADFMGRCITGLTKCIGPKKAPRVCATKWRKSEKLGKKPEGKSFIARGLDDTDAIEACGESCVACEGADAPFDLRAKFDPDEPRDESGKWTDGGGSSGSAAPAPSSSILSGDGPPVVAFHGTIEKVVESIKKEGLHVKPGSHHFEGDVYKGERGESVFVTTKQAVAIEYASTYAQAESWKDYKAVAPVLFRLEIPQKEWVKFNEDKLAPEGSEAHYTKAIPPEWIKGVFKVGSGDSLEEIKSAPGHVSAFMVIFVGEPKDEDKEKDFDEGKHPRDPAGSPTGGQFTSDGGGGDAKPSSFAKDPAEMPDNYERKVWEKSREIAKEVGYDPQKVVILPTAIKKKLMGQTLSAMAASIVTGPDQGKIEVYPDQIHDLKDLPGTIVHEVEHQKFQAAIDDAMKNDNSPVVEALFKVDPNEFASADGVSGYSRAYWEDLLKDDSDLRTTMHETLAEIARLKYETGEFPKHQGGKPSDADVWHNLFNAVDEAYKGLSKK